MGDVAASKMANTLGAYRSDRAELSAWAAYRHLEARPAPLDTLAACAQVASGGRLLYGEFEVPCGVGFRTPVRLPDGLSAWPVADPTSLHDIRLLTVVYRG